MLQEDESQSKVFFRICLGKYWVRIFGGVDFLNWILDQKHLVPTIEFPSILSQNHQLVKEGLQLRVENLSGF